MTDTMMKTSVELGSEVLRLLREGLALLDPSEMHADIGAHVDLAICRLKGYLEGYTPVAPSNQVVPVSAGPGVRSV